MKKSYIKYKVSQEILCLCVQTAYPGWCAQNLEKGLILGVFYARIGANVCILQAYLTKIGAYVPIGANVCRDDDEMMIND